MRLCFVAILVILRGFASEICCEKLTCEAFASVDETAKLTRWLDLDCGNPHANFQLFDEVGQVLWHVFRTRRQIKEQKHVSASWELPSKDPLPWNVFRTSVFTSAEWALYVYRPFNQYVPDGNSYSKWSLELIFTLPPRWRKCFGPVLPPVQHATSRVQWMNVSMSAKAGQIEAYNCSSPKLCLGLQCHKPQAIASTKSWQLLLCFRIASLDSVMLTVVSLTVQAVAQVLKFHSL